MPEPAQEDEYTDHSLSETESQDYFLDEQSSSYSPCVLCTDEECSCLDDWSQSSNDSELSSGKSLSTCTQTPCDGPQTWQTFEQLREHHVWVSQVRSDYLHNEYMKSTHRQPLTEDRPRFMWDVQSHSFVEQAIMRPSYPFRSSVTIAAGMAGYLAICNISGCGQAFIDNMQLDQHIFNEHVDHSSPSTSTIAESETDTPGTPCHHAPIVKMEAEPLHVCEWLVGVEHPPYKLCNQTFADTGKLTEHVNLAHVGARQKQYTCLWAGCERVKPFPQKQKIMRHMVIHTGHRPLRCNTCDYTCAEDIALKQHIRKHSGDRPYRCKDCQRTFRASTSLSVHKRTHTGEKPLECQVCKKRFSESSNMSKHMRTHSSVKPYKCEIEHCIKRFQRPDQLKRHKASVHRVGTIRRMATQ